MRNRVTLVLLVLIGSGAALWLHGRITSGRLPGIGGQPVPGDPGVPQPPVLRGPSTRPSVPPTPEVHAPANGLELLRVLEPDGSDASAVGVATLPLDVTPQTFVPERMGSVVAAARALRALLRERADAKLPMALLFSMHGCAFVSGREVPQVVALRPWAVVEVRWSQESPPGSGLSLFVASGGADLGRINVERGASAERVLVPAGAVRPRVTGPEAFWLEERKVLPAERAVVRVPERTAQPLVVQVVDPDHRPVGGARLTLVRVGDSALLPEVVVETDAHGEARLLLGVGVHHDVRAEHRRDGRTLSAQRRFVGDGTGMRAVRILLAPARRVVLEADRRTDWEHGGRLEVDVRFSANRAYVAHVVLRPGHTQEDLFLLDGEYELVMRGDRTWVQAQPLPFVVDGSEEQHVLVPAPPTSRRLSTRFRARPGLLDWFVQLTSSVDGVPHQCEASLGDAGAETSAPTSALDVTVYWRW